MFFFCFFLIIILYPRNGYCLCGLIKYKYKFFIILRLSVADALTLCSSLSSLSHFAYLIECVGFFRGSAIYK